MDNNLRLGLKIFGWIFLVIMIFIILFLSSIFIPKIVSDEVYTQYFVTMDNTVINKSGANEISFIVNESITSGNSSQRLNKIANLITDNYDDKVVAATPPSLPNSLRYLYDENGHIWVVPLDFELDPYVGSIAHKFSTDPNWLIYQKFGACRELSLIFYHISNQSGFISRIVRTGDGQDSFGRGATHWWNEVEIDGINKTFDVQWYLQIKNNISHGSSWSGNRSDYVNNSDSFSPKQLCSWGGVWLTDDQGREIEDVTDDYMGLYNCSRG